MKAINIKDAATALSLANLCMIKVWAALIGAGIDLPNRFEALNIKSLEASILNTLILGFLFWGVMILVRKSGNSRAREIAHVAFLIALPIPIYGIIITQFSNDSLSPLTESYSQFEAVALMGLSVAAVVGAVMQSKTAVILALAITSAVLFQKPDLMHEGMTLLAFIVLAIALWYKKPTSRIASRVVLILFPFTFVTLGQSVWWISQIRDSSPSTKQPVAQSPQTRVVWLIFDEMDQRIAFTSRPEKVQLPEFERLRTQSLYATNAYPPSDFTLLSMPALITGKFVAKAEPVTPSKVVLNYANSSEWVDWRTQPDIFDKAQEAGIRTAITGWYHPYSEVVGGLDRCSSHYLTSQSLISAMYEQWLSIADSLPVISSLSPMNTIVKKRDLRRRHHINDYLHILRDAKEAATDPKLGLIMAHLPVPHVPVIYNRYSDQLTTQDGGSYLDNLALADKTLGELRQSMENAGMWENSIVLVTSDHWWRADMWRYVKSNRMLAWTREDEELFDKVFSKSEDHRVPFVMKLAGQKETVTYEAEFNTVLTHDLILALLRSEVSDAKQVAMWIDRHRSIGESPYNFHKAK